MIQWKRSWAQITTGKQTLREQVEDFLSGRTTVFTAIIESITDGMIILDEKGTVLYVNEIGASILDLDPVQSKGKHVTELVDFQPVILDAIKKKKGYIEKEFIIESPSKGTLHFIKSAIIFYDADNNVIGVLDTFRRVDIMHETISRLTGARSKFSFEDIIGQEPSIRESVSMAIRAAKCDATVLLEGESGTGKEMFSHAIHNESSRRDGPFIIVNCASLPRSLIESELFGHEAGSFTGARREGYPGKFEQANHGTIFLDEIGEMPLDMQTKLLRVIQDKSFTRIGGKRNITVDTRIIAATNKDLYKEVYKQNFREDLYYRLNVVKIYIPRLYSRKNDIPILTRHFISKIAAKLERPIPEVDERIFTIFMNYNWPGNIRELENTIERAMILSPDDVILPDHLPRNIVMHTTEEEGESERGLESVEKREILTTLIENDGNISLSSKKLGISRNTLYRKLQKYKIHQAY
jgi:PAS domain S-box-containing protein